MPVDHALHGKPDFPHFVIVNWTFLVGGRISGLIQQCVACSPWHVERFGQLQHHGSARGRPARLQKRNMARRHICCKRQIKLTQAANAAPMLDNCTKTIFHRDLRSQF